MLRNRPVHHGMGHRIKDQEILTRQIKADYKEINERWDQVQKEAVDISEIEEILQKIAWVKTGINTVRILQEDRIEGIIWAEMKKIENEILRVEDQIRIKL